MNLLKRALKKIIQHIMKKRQTNITQELDPQNAQLKQFLLENADFGVLLLLGKMYFHVCKFK